jgi:ferredoxin-NADP reductase
MLSFGNNFIKIILFLLRQITNSMAWKWYDAPIVKIEEHSSTVKHFWLNLGDHEFDFESGQFITLDLPISDKRLKRWRSYSIASVHKELPLLELCVVRLEGGAATEYLFDKIQVGDNIRFKGPSGAFVAPQNPDFDMVMICTGTGVAPFRPMIDELLRKQKTSRKIHLIFGTRTEQGLLYREEWEKLEEEF